MRALQQILFAMPQRLKLFTVDDSPQVVKRIHLLVNDVDGGDFLGNAHSMGDALQLIDDLRPDVVILDIQLDKTNPVENGINLLQEVKKRFPVITVIMLSNFSMVPYRKKCLQLGADYFFDKSAEFEKIPAVLKNLINTN
jgi:DNA-binding NarL/FixJ family response regulator